MVIRQRTLARLRLAHRDAGEAGEFIERGCRAAVQHAPARHDQRAFGIPDHRYGARQQVAVRQRAGDMPHALAEQLLRVIPGFRLHVLRQRQGDRAGVGRRGEHAHGFRQGGDELVRSGDAVPVARDRFEAVVDADVLGGGGFQLLQHRRHVAPREDIPRQQQHRQAVDGRQRRAGDHVGRARSDGRGADKGLQAVLHLGVAAGEVHPGLFVAHHDVRKVRVLLQRLADAGHVAVPEDAQHSGKERSLLPVPLNILVAQKADERLRHG